MSPKIKIALLINNLHAPAWIYEIIKRLSESDYAEIAVVIAPTKKTRNIDNRYSAYNLYCKAAHNSGKSLPDAFERKDIGFLIEETPLLLLKDVKHDDNIDDNVREKIKKYSADVAINFGFENFKNELNWRFGTWYFEGANNSVFTRTFAGVTETLQEKCATAITLKINSSAHENSILYRSYSSTHSSVYKNQNLACWKAVSFIPRKLKEIHNTNGKCFWENVNKLNAQYSENSLHTFTSPSNAGFITYLFKRFYKRIKSRLWKINSREQWLLLYSFIKPKEVLSFPSSFDLKELVPPKNKFWADPFVFRSNEKTVVFFEEYIYKNKKAHISLIELDRDGKISEPKIVLEKPYHLSYPFVFSVSKEIYMIPETSGNKTIQLYKSTSFPYKWEFEMNLMEDVHAVDTTILFYNNKFWLFTNIKENKGASAWDELFLFYSDELLTKQWTPHPLNPIVSDVRSARPAGRIFENEGKLFRPSQDCSCTYGYAVNLNEIIVLNENDYCEKKYTGIYPDWNKKVTGVHTFSFSGNLAVIDAKYKTRRSFSLSGR